LRSDILEQEDNDRSELYTASTAFPGKYRVKVTQALGRAIGNRAQLIVTQNAGTEKQVETLFDVNLSDPKEIEFTLETGARKELATVEPEITEARLATTASPQVNAPTGFAAGFGGVDDATQHMVNTPMSAKNAAPVVPVTQETHVPSITPVLPSIRVVSKVIPSQGVVETKGFAVFTGRAVDIPTPKVQLLPGAGQ
jgi:hypothetical protein